MKHQEDKLRTVDFSDLNFNESDWCVPKQTLLEMILDNGPGYVDRLKYKVCLNISEIERFETLLELRTIFQVRTLFSVLASGFIILVFYFCHIKLQQQREKADKVMNELITRFSDEEESKKQIITNKKFNFTIEIAPCYQYVTELFSKYCMDIQVVKKGTYCRSKQFFSSLT